MTNDHNNSRRETIEDVLLHQICVVDGVPILRRRRRLTKAWEIQEVHAVSVVEQRGDSAEALATSAPSVQKNQMPRRGRISDHLIDQAGSVVLEALDAGDCTGQGEGRSVSRRYGIAERRRGISDHHGNSKPLIARERAVVGARAPLHDGPAGPAFVE